MPAAKGDTLVGVPWSALVPVYDAKKDGETRKQALQRVIHSGSLAEGIMIPQAGTPEYLALEERVKLYMGEAKRR